MGYSDEHEEAGGRFIVHLNTHQTQHLGTLVGNSLLGVAITQYQ